MSWQKGDLARDDTQLRATRTPCRSFWSGISCVFICRGSKSPQNFLIRSTKVHFHDLAGTVIENQDGRGLILPLKHSTSVFVPAGGQSAGSSSHWTRRKRSSDNCVDRTTPRPFPKGKPQGRTLRR